MIVVTDQEQNRSAWNKVDLMGKKSAMLVVTDLIQTIEARFGAEGLKSHQEARFSLV
jgi:hypothetical protein